MGRRGVGTRSTRGGQVVIVSLLRRLVDHFWVVWWRTCRRLRLSLWIVVRAAVGGGADGAWRRVEHPPPSFALTDVAPGARAPLVSNLRSELAGAGRPPGVPAHPPLALGSPQNRGSEIEV